jgi:WD40 repeat protein
VSKSKATLTGQDSRFNAIAFSPDGQMLAGGRQVDTAKFWDVALTLTLSQKEREVFQQAAR